MQLQNSGAVHQSGDLLSTWMMMVYAQLGDEIAESMSITGCLASPAFLSRCDAFNGMGQDMEDAASTVAGVVSKALVSLHVWKKRRCTCGTCAIATSLTIGTWKIPAAESTHYQTFP